ncbi:hypothetical protein BVI434_980010 [Burkholderia vietnamiensis]|nr:hypothetical protein BVI434_980010 [Burkholderia vietnamiensis]
MEHLPCPPKTDVRFLLLLHGSVVSRNGGHTAYYANLYHRALGRPVTTTQLYHRALVLPRRCDQRTGPRFLVNYGDCCYREAPPNATDRLPSHSDHSLSGMRMAAQADSAMLVF